MKKSVIKIFNIILVFLIFGCSDATKNVGQESAVIKYKVKIAQPKDGSIITEPLITNGEVEKDSVIIFKAIANNPALQKVKNWTIKGGKLLEGGKVGNENAKIQITENVAVSVQFENVAYIEYVTEKFASTPTMDGQPLNTGDRIFFDSTIIFVAKCDADKIVKEWQINKNNVVASEYLKTFEYTPKQSDAIEKNGKMVINIDFEQKNT